MLLLDILLSVYCCRCCPCDIAVGYIAVSAVGVILLLDILLSVYCC